LKRKFFPQRATENFTISEIKDIKRYLRIVMEPFEFKSIGNISNTDIKDYTSIAELCHYYFGKYITKIEFNCVGFISIARKIVCVGEMKLSRTTESVQKAIKQVTFRLNFIRRVLKSFGFSEQFKGHGYIFYGNQFDNSEPNFDESTGIEIFHYF